MNQDLSGKLAQIVDMVRTGCIEDPLESVEQVSYLIYLKLIDEESDRKLEDISSRKVGAIELAGLAPLPLVAVAVVAGMALGRDVSGKKAVGRIGDLFFPNQARRYRWSRWRSKRGENLRTKELPWRLRKPWLLNWTLPHTSTRAKSTGMISTASSRSMSGLTPECFAWTRQFEMPMRTIEASRRC